MAARKKPVYGTDDKKQVLELAMNNLPVGVGLFYPDGRPLFLNSKLVEFYDIFETLGSPDVSFLDLVDRGGFADWHQDPREHFDKVTQAIAAGRSYSVELKVGDRIIAVNDRPIEGGFLLTTQQDVTDRVRAQERVAHLANHDALTDLPNRAAFSERIADAIDQARATRQKFALLFIDIDHFKDVNDIYGHKAGDALLLEMGRRLRLAAEDSFLARLGGDEFTMIVDHGSQPDTAGALGSRLIDCATSDFEFEGNRMGVGLSIGIAVFPDDGQDIKAMMSSADAALYRAKQDGRGVIRLFESEMDQRMHEQRQLKSDMRDALQRGEFSVAYQPQASVGGEVYGFEVLLRWNHPTKGPIMPEDFIPIAEESGQIFDLGEWVLREACAEAAGWKNPLRIAINLSPVQFRQGDLATLVHQVLLDTGLAPRRLELEITEGVLIRDFTRAVGLLRRLKALGVRIAMDDFGTGYSSLSYLQSFPFDVLKIDKSFVASLRSNDRSVEIIRAMIGLGHGLNLPVVAEGVETSEQLQFLADENCENVQGYFVGAPRPIADYAGLVAGEAPPERATPHKRRSA